MTTQERPPTKNTILVLSELDKSARVAAEYALTLAQALKANILLYNSFLIQSSPFESLPQNASMKFQKNSYAYLEMEAKRLQQLIEANESAFRPDIFYISEEGSLVDNIFNITKKENIILIVKGGCFNHDEDDLLGLEFLTVLKQVKLPILIIPEYS
jgi:hypothetical protein